MTIHLEFLPTLVFILVMICWFAFAGIFIFRHKPPKATERKRESASIVGIALEGLGYAIVWAAHRQLFTPIVQMNFIVELLIATLTVVLAIGSVWIIMAAVRTLGKQWSFAARVVEGHRLIVEGPYRLVRHPIYTGMFGMLLATGLAISHWLSLLVAVLVFLIGTIIRVRSEEKLLREEFGAEFEEYSRRVPALLPLL